MSAALTSSPAFMAAFLCAFASSSTAVVTIGGTLSMPSLSSGESGVGFTSFCVLPP